MKKLLAIIAVIGLLFSCKKEETDKNPPITNPQEHVVKAPGFGPSKEPFNEPAWQLPSGVELEDSIHDYAYCWGFPPYVQVAREDWRGVPLGFTFCFTLRNTTSEKVTVKFPPELIYVSSSTEYQNVVVINIGTIQILADSSTTIVTQGFCLNLGREIPQTFNEEEEFLSYSFGPSALPEPLKEVVDIIESKNISMKDVLNPDGTINNDKASRLGIIQTAIWEVTDKEGLTEATRKELMDLAL